VLNRLISRNRWAAITLLATLVGVLSLARYKERNSPLPRMSPISAVVSVQGDVARPGVYLIQTPAPQIEEAILAAGGIKGGGRPDAMKPIESRRIRSGQQIRVVVQPSGGIHILVEEMDAASRLAIGQKLDVNSATEEELALVPSMRENMAKAIVYNRRERPWEDIAELEEIPGVGPRTVEKWHEYLEIRGADNHVHGLPGYQSPVSEMRNSRIESSIDNL